MYHRVDKAFLSTLSLRRATFLPRKGSSCLPIISIHALLAESDAVVYNIVLVPGEFLSTLSLRRATQGADNWHKMRRISIHALLAESDVNGGAPSSSFGNFYPRSPCGERQPAEIGPNLVNNFYPRSPCGERPAMADPSMYNLYFYPRSPCGERLHYDNYNLHCCEISIHALLAESDVHYDNYNLHCCEISIHALLAESDSTV